jgi:competence protein ComEA
LATWPALKLLARVALVAAGLLLLAWVGRSSLARGLLAQNAPAPDARSSSSPDAPAPTAVPSLVDGSVPVHASSSTVAPAVASAPRSATPHARTRATPEDPVYLNQATLEDLTRLPGVGPKRAEAVLSLRAKLGKFRQPEDLMRVKGIGRATLKRLRPLLRLDAPPDGDASPPATPAGESATTRPP